MSRGLLGWELRKLWSTPLLGIFLLLCLLLNAGVACLHSGDGYIPYTVSITRQLGGQMGPGFDAALSALPDGSYKGVLAQDTAGATDIFEGYDAAAFGEKLCRAAGVTGPAGALLAAKYRRLDAAAARLAACDAALSLFAGAHTNDLLETFHAVCLALLLEGIVFSALLAFYTGGYEQRTGTGGAVCATRMGRGVQGYKLAAGGISALSSFSLLALGTAGVFAALWRLGPLWGANLSSRFHTVGGGLPFITWAPFTLAGYFAATLALSAAVALVCYLLAFAAVLFAGEAARGLLALVLGAGALLLAPLLARRAGLWLLFEVWQFTPAALVTGQAAWFTEGGVQALFPWQELWAALVSLAAALALLGLAWRRFARKDVN